MVAVVIVVVVVFSTCRNVGSTTVHTLVSHSHTHTGVVHTENGIRQMSLIVARKNRACFVVVFSKLWSFEVKREAQRAEKRYPVLARNVKQSIDSR